MLSPAPAKVWDALPGQPTGRVTPPAPVQKQPAAQAESLVQKIGDKLIAQYLV